jgi:uncharacterized membrane protein
VKKDRIALLTVALGCWLIALPLTFEYQRLSIEISDIFCGFLCVFLGLLSLAPMRMWPGFAVGIVGVWLQMAPLLFWAPRSLMYINDTLIGAVAIALSFLLTKKEETIRGNSCPTGWSYNPSGWEHRIPTVILAMLCWFFSRYMAAFQLGYIDEIWDPFFVNGTLQVITSNISKSFPVSDAGLGAFCYTLEFLLGWQGSSQRWSTMPWLVFAFAFLVIPVGVVSITLIILQPVVVGAWCSWCLATAICMLLMIILTAGELAASFQFLKEVKRKGGNVWKTFWKGEWGARDLIEAKPYSRPLRLSFGITFPWNLVLSIILGIWLMASPSFLNLQGGVAISDYIEGPMIVAFSTIAFAELFRAIRYLNILFGLSLILTSLIVPATPFVGIANNIIIGILIIALCFRKGRISERYGSWEKFIL